MIGDIIDFFKKNLSEYIDWIKFVEYWNLQEFDIYFMKEWPGKRSSIDKQSEMCILFIYKLII